MAVVKADGFGHGAVDVARTALAHGATWLGVTSLDEALAAARGRARRPDAELAQPGRRRLRRGARGRRRPRRAEPRAPRRRRRRVGPHRRPRGSTCTSTPGMARDGAAPAAVAAPVPRRPPGRAPRPGRVVGVMGHLGCADDPADPGNAAGRARFAWGVERARAAGLRPAAAAPGRDRRDPHRPPLAPHHGRVGAGLVGIDPSRTTALRPAMTLTAPVVAVRRVRAGTAVGYGHAWTAPAGDPPRPAAARATPTGCRGSPSGQAEVLLRGQRRPVVGRISMDQLVVDLGDAARRARRDRDRLRARARRRAHRRRVGRLGRHHRARDRHRHRRPGRSDAPVAPSPACGACVTRTRVAVIGGGQNCEHDVSLASAAVGRAQRSTRDGVRRGPA